jgi:hypothetical protein
MTGVPTASDSTTVCGKFSHAEESRLASARGELEHLLTRQRAEEANTPLQAEVRGAPLHLLALGAVAADEERDAGHLMHGLEPDLERLLATDPPGEGEERPVDADGLPRLFVRRQLRQVRRRVGDDEHGSRGTPQETAISARYALGQMTRVARPSAAFLDRRSARMRASPATCWKASMSPSNMPRRRARSYASSVVSLVTSGVRATLEPAAARPIMLVA